MKYLIRKIIPVILLGAIVSSCNIEDIPDPNNLSVSADPSEQQLQLYAVGIENLMRTEIGFWYDVTSIIGREQYFFTNSDPRYTGELLGKGDSQLDPAGFYGTRPYAGRYKVIKNVNLLLEGLMNTSVPLTNEERNAYSGYAKTAEGYSLLLALHLQYQNGIRVDVADIANLGPFVSYSEALTAIKDILDEGAAELDQGGSEFPFSLSSGFAGFDTPDKFRDFNRAIAARVALYDGRFNDVPALLNDSFMDMAGDLNVGPAHFYSTAGTDLPNLVFRTPDQSEALVAHPSYVTDIDVSDDRMNKVALRTTTAVLDGLSSDYDVVLYASLSSPIPIIRNEELILMMAEARIQNSDLPGAVTALNVIRNAHGLADYAGVVDMPSVMAELVYNRRYSLFGEGHRWVDMRRWGLLSQLPLDRAGDDVWEQMPRPVSETE
jgi:hypothetical protein